MRPSGIIGCAFLSLGLLLPSAAFARAGHAQARFPLAQVDAVRLTLGSVRTAPSWSAVAAEFPRPVRWQDPRGAERVPSPDGRAWVWRGRDAGGYWLYYRAVGGRTRRLADCHNAYQPVWSPDSRRVAYCAMRWPPHLRGLYVVAPGRPGARPRLEFSAKGHLGASLAWSPDGSKIVFDYYGRLWIMNSDGLGRCLLDLSGRVGRPVTDAERVAFSRDGTRMAWQPLGQRRVYVMELKERR